VIIAKIIAKIITFPTILTAYTSQSDNASPAPTPRHTKNQLINHGDPRGRTCLALPDSTSYAHTVREYGVDPTIFKPVSRLFLCHFAEIHHICVYQVSYRLGLELPIKEGWISAFGRLRAGRDQGEGDGVGVGVAMVISSTAASVERAE